MTSVTLDLPLQFQRHAVSGFRDLISRAKGSGRCASDCCVGVGSKSINLCCIGSWRIIVMAYQVQGSTSVISTQLGKNNRMKIREYIFYHQKP